MMITQTAMTTTTFGITECIGCGHPFLQTNKFQKRCKKNCGRSRTSQHGSRTRKRSENVRQFIGVDGEGITRPNGEHIYDMLSVGTETLTSPDGSQLHYKDIFEFLYGEFQKNPHAIFVGFFLGYDFTQWLRTLPENRAAMLLTPQGRATRQRKQHTYLGPFPVDDGVWEFDLLGMKRFKLRPCTTTDNAPWMYICDTGPYFQTSFLNVINPANWHTPIVTDEEFSIVERGKAERNIRLTHTEQLEKRSETAKYNTLENIILARVLEQLNSGFTAMGVRLQKDQWYGPGQAAQAWMHNINIPTHQEVLDAIPEWVWESARYSYYGGWFEIFAHGHIPGHSYEYDLNSAYPHVISQLPCLLHGDWTREVTPDLDLAKPRNGLLLVHATVHGSDPIVGTMIHRTTLMRNCRPHHTQGWYWGHELESAIRAGLIDDWQVHEMISYEPCTCPPVYGTKMHELYQHRLRVGKNTPAGKAAKLMYNSAYGKHAQSIGNPRFANSVYASLITAGCRTMILNAIASHPTKTHSLLMVATDGVIFREPHPHLDLSPEELGKWEETRRENLCLFMPGMYWDDSTRQSLREGKAPALKSRGISSKDLANKLQQLDLLWPQLQSDSQWPELEIPVNFNMITCTQALARGKWSLAGITSHDDVRVISANPHTKRIPQLYHTDGIGRSYVYPIADRLESTPYDKHFGKPEPLGISPDGPLEMIVKDMIQPENPMHVSEDPS